MSVINTNYLALVSQNNLSKSQGALGTAIERLSSGLRINSAKDDAAGQAIANRFTANIKGLTQAARNANDGVSIAQTTEGALNEINNNLQRVRELTVQAANGSNSESDLQSIQNEIDERLGEIDRVSKETQFNGKYILGKDADALNIQVGAHDGEQITINLTKIDKTELGLANFQVTGKELVADAADGDTFAAANGNEYSFATTPVVGTDSTTVAIPAAAAVTTALGDDAPDGTNTLVMSEGGNAFIKNEDADGNISYYAATINVEAGTAGASATIDSITLGAKVNRVTEEAADAGLTSNPLKALDDALQDVDDLRSHLGAIQNRFQSTIANLNNTVNNLSAARSRIEDADYAVEVSNMTRAQILQQAGTSVLAQANQVPQGVLSLLR